MKLNDAIQEQMNRMSEEPVVPSDNTEIKSLLEAFISVIHAYLKRLGSSDEHQVSDTFGSLG